MERRVAALAGAGEELTQRLEAARAEARQRIQAHYGKLDFFDRRLIRSFPTLRSTRHNEALEQLRAYWEEVKHLHQH